MSRTDPSVHNTRRFAHVDTAIAGTLVRAGDGILVLLAAADHDPVPRARPELRPLPAFTFGLGVHACIGRELACALATAGVETLLASGFDPACLTGAVRYRPSLANRVPYLDAMLHGAGATSC